MSVHNQPTQSTLLEEKPSHMNYDIVIVGGGLVGCSLALGLSQLPLKVALVDPTSHENLLKVDGRTLALSATSCKILHALCFGLRQSTDNRFIDQLEVYPIKAIHISEQYHFSMTRLKASDVGLPVLGYSIEMNALLAFLYNELSKATCHLISEKVKDAEKQSDVFNVQLENQTITTKLLIGADGDHSFLRKILNIPVKTHDYKQSAFVTTVEVTGEHVDTAFERFIPGGSIALLPIAKNKMKLVWIASTDDVNILKNLMPEVLLSKLQKHMGCRLGTFHTLSNHHFIYPLKFQYASHQIQEKFALIGNAVHTLHPIAAQGFNLSLRDIAIFVETIQEALLNQRAIGCKEVLQSYVDKRLPDQKYAANLTHYLANSSSCQIGVAIRGLVFNLLECFPSVKKGLIGLTTGSSAVLPRWVYRIDL